MKVIDVIKNRRSIRKFKKKNVRPEPMKVILDAARWAPSASNRQPWKFIILSEKDDKELVARLYVDAYKKEANDVVLRDDADQYFEKPYEVKKRILEMTDLLWDQMANPQYIVLVCANTKKSKSYLFESGCAVQNMMLAAWEMGIGSCVIEIATSLLSEYFDIDTLKNYFAIPEHIEVVSLVPMGFPEKIPPPPPRELLRDFHFRHYWIPG
ncbi:MAG: nitroreductase family protein [Euryarchaeota archaeon]|nr:nitroreductase family protein [Euryarchaeota archaeon]